MAEREKEEIVVNDRRKFRFNGDQLERVEQPASDERAEEARAPEPVPAETQQQAATRVASDADGDNASTQSADQIVADANVGGNVEAEDEAAQDSPGPAAGPSAEEVAASQNAYQATAERMDDLMRASNPGAPQDGPANFERVIQSLYITAIVQLGLNTPAGQQMRVDLLAARHTIDMLGVIAEKTKGNTTEQEDKLMKSALFELRMSFLEVTQMLAQNAQQQAAKANPKGGVAGLPPLPGGKIKL